MSKYNDRDPDTPATFKQSWAVAYQFAKLSKHEFPDYEIGNLANMFKGAIYYYLKERDEVLTHQMVTEYLQCVECPRQYINHLKQFLQKSKSNLTTKNKENDDSTSSDSLQNLIMKDLDS